MAPQIKIFSNGVKAVLRPQTKRKPALLTLLDKDGCTIAQRKISAGQNWQGKYLEKLTVKATNDPYYGVDLIKDYKASIWNKKGKLSTTYSANGEYVDSMKGLPNCMDNEITCGLGWTEKAQEYSSTFTNSDKTLWKMMKQWVDIRKTNTQRTIPKPINNSANRMFVDTPKINKTI